MPKNLGAVLIAASCLSHTAPQTEGTRIFRSPVFYPNTYQPLAAMPALYPLQARPGDVGTCEKNCSLLQLTEKATCTGSEDARRSCSFDIGPKKGSSEESELRCHMRKFTTAICVTFPGRLLCEC